MTGRASGERAGSGVGCFWVEAEEGGRGEPGDGEESVGFAGFDQVSGGDHNAGTCQCIVQVVIGRDFICLLRQLHRPHKVTRAETALYTNNDIDNG